MRRLFLLVSLLVVTVWVVPWSQLLSPLTAPPAVVVKGNDLLSEAEVLAPVADWGTVWWLVSPRSVSQSLVAEPYISDATVSWGLREGALLFNLVVSERRPRYVVALRGEPWVVARDGAFLGPLRLMKESRLASVRSDVVVVEELFRDGDSPDVLTAQVAFLRALDGIVERSVPLPLRSVRLRSSREAELMFGPSDRGVTAVFGGEDLDVGRVSEQARRLGHLVLEMSARPLAVDLAYDQVAVVRPVGGEGVSPSSRPSAPR